MVLMHPPCRGRGRQAVLGLGP